MKISWKHLSELIDLRNISTKEVATKLTLAGLEVDIIEYVGGATQDTILNIDITANRQDLLGWAQIAVELSAAIKRPLIIKDQLDNIRITHLYKNISAELFSEAYVYYISNADLRKRNNSLVNHLRTLGFSSTGSILDVVNFVNLKWGQSIAIYKLENIVNEEIKHLTFKTDWEASQQKYKLKVGINNKKLSLITESNIESGNRTSSILLINYSNKKNNESYCINACLELLSLIEDKAITNTKKHFLSIQDADKNAKSHETDYSIECTAQDINKLLGPTKIQGIEQLLNIEAMSEITQSLYLQTEFINDNMRVVIPPARQIDIRNSADLAEEIARIYGFNKFYDNLPRFNNTSQRTKITTVKQKIRYVLRSMGLHEIISYSFQTKEQESNSIHIANPLSKEQKSLRSNIIGGIMEAKKYNINQGNCRLEAFEIGNVFNKSTSQKKHKELTHLSWLLSNNNFNKSSWQTPGAPLTWMQAKGHTEELFERLDAKISWSTSMQNNLFIKSLKKQIHPAKRIYIQHNSQTIGVLSKVNESNSIADSSSYFTEIRLDKLIQSIGATSNLAYIYNHYSNYPKISRDFSITIGKRVAMANVNRAIMEMQRQENNSIESITLLSEYYNNQHKKTICLRVNYRSKDKTLTRNEVKILDNMLKSQLANVLE